MTAPLRNCASSHARVCVRIIRSDARESNGAGDYRAKLFLLVPLERAPQSALLLHRANLLVAGIGEVCGRVCVIFGCIQGVRYTAFNQRVPGSGPGRLTHKSA